MTGFVLWTGADEYRYSRGLKFTSWIAIGAMMFALLLEVLLISVFKVVARG